MHIHAIGKQTNVACGCYDELFWLLLSPVNCLEMLINMYLMSFLCCNLYDWSLQFLRPIFNFDR